MKTAIFPGTFDPPNLGHIDVIKRASKLVDRLYVAIGHNSLKPHEAFSLQERLAMLKKAVEGISNVEIVSFEGLLVDFIQQKSIGVIIRSIRTVADFDAETMQAHMNRKLSGIETLYMVPGEQYNFISSTLIRELAQQGKKISQFVPESIEKDILEHLAKKK